MDNLDRLSPSLEILSRLESILQQISVFLKRHGINKSGLISAKNREIFLSWAPDRLTKTTETAEKILRMHLSAEQEDLFEFDDSPRLLSVALRELNLSVDPSFLPLIDRSDIMEVYDNDHIQVFRSFNFFRICNYNLDDVLSHEWFELYERADSVTKDIMNITLEHISSRRPVTRVVLQDHVMRERFSEVQGMFTTKFKYFANVYAGPEKTQGYVVIISAKPLDTDTSKFNFLHSQTRNFKKT